MKQTLAARLLPAAALAVAAANLLAAPALAAPDGWLGVDGQIRFNAGGGATVDWANSGVGGPSGTCPAGAVDVEGMGGIFNCGSPAGAGSAPNAPTLTPAAAADPSIISAVFISDPISTDSTACGAGDPTVISGKNGDAISSYAIGNGPVPAKDDLSNVYAVSHTRAGNGHPEIYFAAEKLVNNGDSHMDFEFLQSGISRTATCGGSLTGHRTQGDLLVAVDFTNGGGLAGFTVFQWHCAPLPAPQAADGTVCDPGAGPLYEQIVVPAAISLTVNSADVPCGGWVCRDQISGNSTVVSTNDFLEGGIDLGAIPFIGCFNTFLPHTRTAPSFTAQLKDFTGPVDFRSCRTPAMSSTSTPGGGATVAPGVSATDTVNVTNGGAGPTPTGSVTFFECAPAQSNSSGCPSGGSQVGTVKPLAAGAATSDPAPAASAPGTYCWRAVFVPDAASTGVFVGAAHTNATTECFGVVAATLPNTGVPDDGSAPIGPLAPLLAISLGLLAIAWRRGRVVGVLLIAWMVTSASPATSDAISTPHELVAPVAVSHLLYTPAATTNPLSTERARAVGWRVVIGRIGVDAPIEPVGREAGGAMASPSSLDTVGWFNQGPKPGAGGDAVLDGHFGLPSAPAVFRNLHVLRPGDTIHVSWPDGRGADFRVASMVTVAADAQPRGLFASGGPARLALITCAGTWDQGRRTYTERLIVTADLI
ncbi:MAG TPA: class F sortase [Candidatus Dormibacteraeota bacterium]|nr:class F sortase [Candidatus Dormibacteraeota bacterium]